MAQESVDRMNYFAMDLYEEYCHRLKTSVSTICKQYLVVAIKTISSELDWNI